VELAAGDALDVTFRLDVLQLRNESVSVAAGEVQRFLDRLTYLPSEATAAVNAADESVLGVVIDFPVRAFRLVSVTRTGQATDTDVVSSEYDEARVTAILRWTYKLRLAFVGFDDPGLIDVSGTELTDREGRAMEQAARDAVDRGNGRDWPHIGRATTSSVRVARAVVAGATGPRTFAETLGDMLGDLLKPVVIAGVVVLVVVLVATSKTGGRVSAGPLTVGR
jgi:hypothetical protein